MNLKCGNFKSTEAENGNEALKAQKSPQHDCCGQNGAILKLWWGGASGRGRRAYGALTTALRKNENKSPGRSHAPAGIQPPIKITRPVPFRLVQPVMGSYQTGNLSRSLISALFLQQFCRKKAARAPSPAPHGRRTGALCSAAQIRTVLRLCRLSQFAGSFLPAQRRLYGT